MNPLLQIDIQLLSYIVDGVETGVILVDQHHNVCLWNKCMQNYTSIGSQQALGKDIDTLMQMKDDQWLISKIKTALVGKLSTNDYGNIFDICRDTSLHHYQEVKAFHLTTSCTKQQYTCLVITGISSLMESQLLLHEANEKLKTQAKLDLSTQLFNKDYWMQCLADEVHRCQHVATPSSLVIFDIDNFKEVNDRYGHLAGDETIIEVARSFHKTIRTNDIACRFGGDEFAVILPNTNAGQAELFAKRLRREITNATIEKQTGKVSISIGICVWSANMQNEREWFKGADDVLYISKRQGRNRITVSTDMAVEYAE